MDPIQKNARNPKLGTMQCLLTQSVRCCNAFAHAPTSPPSLDSRCSAIGPEPEAPDNGQAIDAGQAAASIHRMHHPNERPVGVAKTGNAEGPIPAACTALGVHYLPPSGACSRHKLLVSGRRRAHRQCLSLPTTPSERTGKIRPEQPEEGCHAVVPVGIVAKANWPLEKSAKRSLSNYRGFKGWICTGLAHALWVYAYNMRSLYVFQ
jgi:hypothetical protein